MYQHIGKKLKIVAEILCVVGILGCITAGVLLYFTKTLDLLYCILIGAGGVILSLLLSMCLYAVGDIHAKMEKLEDKLLPKPSYASYLEENQVPRGQCEICGRTTDLISAKIVDQLGTRYRKVCRECFAANNCEQAE